MFLVPQLSVRLSEVSFSGGSTALRDTITQLRFQTNNLILIFLFFTL